ncbi:hypothetical protein GGI15_001716 [Coemansia interrupta]|uniref:Uncharacterized protein n=1 Tax=Coemansia interrupta TaxID=1126814 RepID=A0A9W8LMJ7_9FUNG|nr:hypothetical protein GGI15_001716 [Coemansia interrupta]
MAVVEFNKNTSESEKTYLTGDTYTVETSSYTQRSVSSSSSNWNTPQLTDQSPDLYQTCDIVGGLYKPNLSYMSCSSEKVNSALDNSCKLPYSALYTSIDKKLVLVGLFSYSVVLGTDMCADTCISFYTYIANYIPFVVKVLGRDIDVSLGSDITNSSALPSFDLVVNPPDYVDMTGKLRVGGNLYALQTSEPSSSATPTDTPTNTPMSEPDNSTSTGLGKTPKIIIGVVVPVTAIIAALCVLFGYRWWNKKHANRNWKPQAEELHLREIANDLVVDESVRPPNLRPPPYSASGSAGLPLRHSTVTTATAPSIAEEMSSLSEFDRHDVNVQDKK